MNVIHDKDAALSELLIKIEVLEMSEWKTVRAIDQDKIKGAREGVFGHCQLRGSNNEIHTLGSEVWNVLDLCKRIPGRNRETRMSVNDC